jgi:hypothetical protein
LAGIGGAHPAWFFVAVERERVGLDLRTPERGFEALGELASLFGKPLRGGMMAEPARAGRGHAFGGIDVALHLGQRDGAVGKLAVGVKHCVVRIFPALIGEALLGGALILDKTIAVGIARPVDPAQRRLDVRPQLRNRVTVAGALDIKSGQQHEQRRGIDAAVVHAERHFAQRRHLAAAHLVQNLPRLGVGQRIGGLGLKGCKPPQHAARDVGTPPQHLQRRDQAVAAERGRKPWNAGVRIRPLRRLRRQDGEIGG